jgi:hypothetical protein
MVQLYFKQVLIAGWRIAYIGCGTTIRPATRLYDFVIDLLAAEYTPL